jgi:hypothetical protein
MSKWNVEALELCYWNGVGLRMNQRIDKNIESEV